jgi:ubiquitin-conjugating enzyme E2 Z
MNKSSVRVMNDYIDFTKNKPDNIYLWIDKSNIYQQFALIIGPKNTPYFGGFYFFSIVYPVDYPNNPPKLTLLTVNNNVRFNPNLYEDGKVCLSILGTWSGPSWKPIMNIRLVLQSIISLLGEYPVKNEPGFENVDPTNIISIEYNLYVVYYNYKVAIIDVINNCKEGKYSDLYKIFEKEIKEELKLNFNKLKEDLLSYQTIYGRVPVNKQIYFMREQILDFNDIVNDFINIENIKI